VFRSAGPAGRDAVVLNAAAFTDVDGAEADPRTAYAVNEHGARLIAARCAEHGIPLIHFSTDYVFDGRRPGAYTEEDATAPLNVYGASKLAGEAAVRAACPRHLILRCSTLFGPRSGNFLTAVIRRARAGATVRVVSDQRSSPTPAAAVAAAAIRLARETGARGAAMPFGTYHFGGEPAVSRFEFAQAIFAAAAERGLPPPQLEAVTAAQVSAPARRPANSALDSGKMLRNFGIASPDWRLALRPCMEELLHDRNAGA